MRSAQSSDEYLSAVKADMERFINTKSGPIFEYLLARVTIGQEDMRDVMDDFFLQVANANTARLGAMVLKEDLPRTRRAPKRKS